MIGRLLNLARWLAYETTPPRTRTGQQLAKFTYIESSPGATVNRPGPDREESLSDNA